MKIVDTWLAYNRQQRVIILACLALFLPFYMTCIIDAGLLLFSLMNGDLKKSYQNVDQARWILPFTVLSIVVSLYYHNYLGILCSFGFLIIFSMVVYYQYYGNEALLKQIIYLYVLMSIPCAIYGLMEYNGILDTLGVEDFTVMVMDSPLVRLNSVFFNANYYAMMIEFFSLMIISLLLRTNKTVAIFFYLATLLLNLFMLYLSGCRTAWPALIAGTFVLVLFHKDKRWLFGVLILALVLAIVFFISPGLFPRADNIFDYFQGRVSIWKVSFDNISKHLLFGEGPLTYMLIYPNYPGAIVTQHAHNIFIDPILSYGVIGVATIFPYFKARYQEWQKCTNSNHKTLMKAIVVTTLVHGLLDYTVYFVPTGFTFLLILGSAFPKKNNKTAKI